MSRKKQVYEKITALYCRISLDDGGDNESMSISNQKIMLRDFAEKHGMFQYEYYVDDKKQLFPISIMNKISMTAN